MAHSFNAAQDAILAQTNMTPTWLFETSGEYWSTKAYTYSSQDYDAKVIPESFAGIKLTRSKSEHGVQTPDKFTFTIENKDRVLAESDFQTTGVFNALTVKLLYDGTLFLTWTFKITRVDDVDETLIIYCGDYLTQYLEGSWPNTELFTALAPDDTGEHPYCVPVVFGTAFIPTPSLFISADDRYYILSASALGTTWTVDEVRSPRDWGGSSTWTSTDYTFTNAEKAINGTNYRVYQPFIAGDGNDSAGFWYSGNRFLAPLTKFSVSGGSPDMSTMTDFADVLEYILEDMGVPSARIDSAGTFATAQGEITAETLTFNYGFFQHQDRQAVIANILNACNCYISVTDKIEMHWYDNTSQMTLTDEDVKNFKVVSSATATIYDGAYVAFQESGEPQDELTKYAVAADNSSYSNISSDTLNIPYYTNDQKAVRACQLWQQRKWYGDKKFSFDGKPAQIELMPDDTITINQGRYGGSYTALVDSIYIDQLGMPHITILRLDTTVENFDTNTPSNMTFVADDTTIPWTAGEPMALPTDQYLVGYWPLDDGPNAAKAFDRSKYGNHGTMYSLADWVAGVAGQCPDFDGSADYISVPDDDDLDSIKTFVCWFYPPSEMSAGGAYHRTIVNKYYEGRQHGLVLWDYTTPDEIRIYFTDSTNSMSIASYGIPAYGKWYHVAGVFNSDNKSELFINGESVDVGGSINNALGSDDYMSAYPLLIGSGDESNTYLEGRVCQVRVYDRALSADEIKALYISTCGVQAMSDATQIIIEEGLTIASGGLILNAGGYMKTTGKDDYDDATSGVYIGYDNPDYCIGITDGTSHFHFGTTDGFSMKVGSGKTVDIDGTINMGVGADIYMEATSGDRAVIDFEVDNSRSIRITADHDDERMAIFPSTDEQCLFAVGYDQSGTEKRFNEIHLRSYEYLWAICTYDSTHETKILQHAGATYDLNTIEIQAECGSEVAEITVGFGDANTSKIHLDADESLIESDILEINQGAADGNILQFKSSDVSHSMTTQASASVYGTFAKLSATAGGLKIQGLRDDESAGAGVRIVGIVEDPGHGTYGPVEIDTYEHDDGTSARALSGTDKVFVVRTGGSAIFHIDADGDIYYNTAHGGTYDDYEDIDACQDLALIAAGDEDKVSRYNKDELKNMGLVWIENDVITEKEQLFISTKNTNMLQLGAFRELTGIMKEFMKELNIDYTTIKDRFRNSLAVE